VLLLDLREVTYLDSAGVRMVVQAHRWQAAAGNRLMIVPGTGFIGRLLRMSGLSQLLAPDGCL
jgi:anti-anti-sigma factor